MTHSSPVLTSLITPPTACDQGRVRGCAISGETLMQQNRKKEVQSSGQPMLDVRSW